MKDTYQIIDSIVATVRAQRQNLDYDGLLTSGLACIEYSVQLAHYGVDMEKEYRKAYARLVDEKDENGKQVSVAWADAKARDTEGYNEWRRAEKITDTLTDLSNMTKKIAGGLDREYNAT